MSDIIIYPSGTTTETRPHIVLEGAQSTDRLQLVVKTLGH